MRVYRQRKPNNALRAIVYNHKIKIIVEKAIVFFYIFREYAAIILCNAPPLHRRSINAIQKYLVIKQHFTYNFIILKSQQTKIVNILAYVYPRR